MSLNETAELSNILSWYDVLFNTSTGLFGIILNCWLIVVTLRKNVIEGNFKIYVGNLATADILYALVTLLETVYSSLIPSYNGLLCKVQGYFLLTSIALTTIALLPVTLNRYVGIFHDNFYHRFTMTSKPGILLCIICDLSAFGCSAFLASQANLGKKQTGALKGICYIYGKGDGRFGRAYMALLVGLALLHVGMLVANAKIYWMVRAHQSLVKRLKNKTRIKETKQQTRATLAQALIPMAIQLPIIIVVLYRVIRTFQGHKFKMNGFVKAALVITRITPVTDSIITIVMLKQYRKVFSGWLQNVKNQSCALATGNAVVAIKNNEVANPKGK